MQISDIHKIMKRYDGLFTRNLSVSSFTMYDVYRFKATIPVIGNKIVCKTAVKRVNKDDHKRTACYYDYRKINDANSIADAIDISQQLTDESLNATKITDTEFADLITFYVALANKLIMLDKQETLIKQIEGD